MQDRRIIENKLSATLMIFLSVLILITRVQGVEINGRSIGHKLPTDSTLLPRPVTEHFVTVDGLRVHYIESGTGPTVVMIHGNAGSVDDFEFGAMDLLASGYRVVGKTFTSHTFTAWRP